MLVCRLVQSYLPLDVMTIHSIIHLGVRATERIHVSFLFSFSVLKEAFHCQNSHQFCSSCIYFWSLDHSRNHHRCTVCRCDGLYTPNREVWSTCNAYCSWEELWCCLHRPIELTEANSQGFKCSMLPINFKDVDEKHCMRYFVKTLFSKRCTAALYNKEDTQDIIFIKSRFPQLERKVSQ